MREPARVVGRRRLEAGRAHQLHPADRPVVVRRIRRAVDFTHVHSQNLVKEVDVPLDIADAHGDVCERDLTSTMTRSTTLPATSCAVVAEWTRAVRSTPVVRSVSPDCSLPRHAPGYG